MERPEFSLELDAAANSLELTNSLVKELHVQPLTVDWVQKSLADRGLVPPPPPPRPDCINSTVVLEALTRFDLASKARVKTGTAVVDARDLHFNYAGSLFFMFTLQTTIGYGTFVPNTHEGKLAVILLGMVTVCTASVCLEVFVNSLDAALEVRRRVVSNKAAWPRATRTPTSPVHHLSTFACSMPQALTACVRRPLSSTRVLILKLSMSLALLM